MMFLQSHIRLFPLVIYETDLDKVGATTGSYFPVTGVIKSWTAPGMQNFVMMSVYTLLIDHSISNVLVQEES